MKRTISSLIFAGLVLFLAACTKTTINQLPLGPISATGTLIPAEVALLRRGTHLLLVNGKETYYVESKTEDLVSVEGRTVFIEGIAEANTSKDDLPVLMVSKLTSVNGETGLHVWNIPALDLRIQTPDSWKGTIEKNIVTFRKFDELAPLVVITGSGGAPLPSLGKPFYLSGHRAMRIDTKTGSGSSSDIFVQGKGILLHLHFDTAKQVYLERMEDVKLLQSEFEYAVHSLKFLSDNADKVTGSGSDALMSCGGAGNTVCPQGFFCNVTDPDAKIGECKAIKS